MSGMDEEELKAFDLTANRINMPSEITGRLALVSSKQIVKMPRLRLRYFGIENYEADEGASKRNARNNTFKENITMPVLGSNAVIDEKNVKVTV